VIKKPQKTKSTPDLDCNAIGRKEFPSKKHFHYYTLTLRYDIVHSVLNLFADKKTVLGLLLHALEMREETDARTHKTATSQAMLLLKLRLQSPRVFARYKFH
jgi:hypothetical protein